MMAGEDGPGEIVAPLPAAVTLVRGRAGGGSSRPSLVTSAEPPAGQDTPSGPRIAGMVSKHLRSSRRAWMLSNIEGPREPRGPDRSVAAIRPARRV
jgi:hypothetical protein